MPETTPHPSTREPQPDASQANPDATAPKPAEQGALFRALVESGCDPILAYTAEKRMHTMVSDAIGPQLQPFVEEMRRGFADIERRFEQVDRRFEQVDHRFEQVDHRLDALAAAGVERDRRLDVLVTQMRLLLGGLGLLITVLIAVFGFLFATN